MVAHDQHGLFRDSLPAPQICKVFFPSPPRHSCENFALFASLRPCVKHRVQRQCSMFVFLPLKFQVQVSSFRFQFHLRCSGSHPTSADDFIGDNVISRQSGDQTAPPRRRQIEKAVRMADKNGRAPLKFLSTASPASQERPRLYSSTSPNATSGAPPSSTAPMQDRGIEEIAAGLHTKACSASGACSD